MDLKRFDNDTLVGFGQALVVVENKTCQGLIIVFFGDTQIIFFVQIIDFQSAGEDVFPVAELFFHPFGGVVFIFYLAEDLFKDILDGDDPRGATELINHQGDVLFLLYKKGQQLIGRHGLRDNDDRIEHIFQAFGVGEKILDLHISDNVVDTAVVNEQFGQAGFDEGIAYLIKGGALVEGYQFGTGYQTLPQFDTGEIQGILEYTEVMCLLRVRIGDGTLIQ